MITKIKIYYYITTDNLCWLVAVFPYEYAMNHSRSLVLESLHGFTYKYAIILEFYEYAIILGKESQQFSDDLFY